MLESETEAVECATDVQTFAFADDVPSAKFDFLTTDAQANVLRGIADIDERLMQIGDVLVRQTRSAVAALFQAALKLRKEPKFTAEMPVRVEKIPLQDVSVGACKVRAKTRIVVVFVFVPDLPADREIPILASKPNVLQVVKSFFFAIRIREQAPVLIVTKRNENGPLFLALRPSNGSKGK
jgi:hypothetical protein